MIAKSIIFLIKAYQFLLSPLLGQNCRFYPSCSHYAIEAVDQHGCVCGGLLAVKRIVKCQPFHPGGLDPVPGSSRKNRKKLHPQNPELN